MKILENVQFVEERKQTLEMYKCVLKFVYRKHMHTGRMVFVSINNTKMYSYIAVIYYL
jgi:hypothetical protein